MTTCLPPVSALPLGEDRAVESADPSLTTTIGQGNFSSAASTPGRKVAWLNVGKTTTQCSPCSRLAAARGRRGAGVPTDKSGTWSMPGVLDVSTMRDQCSGPVRPARRPLALSRPRFDGD
jgi:hypothetical protein